MAWRFTAVAVLGLVVVVSTTAMGNGGDSRKPVAGANHDVAYLEKKLWSDCAKHDFSIIEELKSQRGLAANQFDTVFMNTVRTVILLKNDVPFLVDEETRYFQKRFRWYKAAGKGVNDRAENDILAMINSRLEPDVVDLPFSDFTKVQNGIWQVDSFDLADGYLQSIRLHDGKFEIYRNEMQKSERFRRLVGTYSIERSSLLLRPRQMFVVQGGVYIGGDEEGLVEKFIGGAVSQISLAPDAVLSYPVISLQKLQYGDRAIYRIWVFTDKPHYYYKVK